MSRRELQPTAVTEVPTESSGAPSGTHRAKDALQPALVLVWSLAEPERVGEAVLVPARGTVSFGRSSSGDSDPPCALLTRQRPGRTDATGPLRSPRISRQQLLLSTLAGGKLQVENVGRCPMLRSGTRTAQATLRPGDLIVLEGQLALLCTERPPVLPEARDLAPSVWPDFGEPDPFGIVGEAPETWALRDRLAFVAPLPGHVLLSGPSGTGKELAARAVHRLSPRGSRPLVARNAATFPPGLIDAELFGNIRDFPNAGMRERPGLVGEASGSTLFLDEIGELPEALQTHLLRVLDRDGEYQRLGDARPLRADVRFVAATNRPVGHLKSDLRARLVHTVSLPPLSERREDIPLLVRALLRRAAAEDPRLGARLGDEPRVSLELMLALLAHPLPLNVRELEAILFRSLSSSAGPTLELPPDLAAPAEDEALATDPQDVTPEQIQECLDRHGGVQGPVWRELGFRNRYVLQRLIRKHGLRTTDEG